jgi:HSP20 family molecular chaperone IbpA
MGDVHSKDKTMKERRFVTDELLASIDVLNTLGGGLSQPQMKLKQFSNHREIRLKVPGVKEENLHVEIHNNVLSVFYTIFIQSNLELIEVPKVIYNKQIPYFVDAEKISASFKDELFTVTLPFNSMAQGYHRSVTTEK